MPEYKKKRVNRLRGAPKPRRKKPSDESLPDDIEMHPSQKREKKSTAGYERKTAEPMRVVKGKKLERRRKIRIFISAAAVVAAVCIVLHLVLPVGIFENIQNLTALIGSGSYPAELESSEVLNTATRGGYYYVLTDTRINAYSDGGKEIYSYVHGYENPVLKTSRTRALVFSQGADEALIYNLQSLKGSVKTEEPIITANISDSGAYALVTESDSYKSVVSVYNKNNEKIYEWYSAEDTVNCVAVSPNGKKIAVAAFNASSGDYASRVSVLEFDSATPVFTESYEGTLVYDIDTFHNSGFFVLTENEVRFIEWSDYGASGYENDYSASMFRTGSGGAAAVFSRSSDRTDNRVAFFDSKGKLKSEFEFKGVISDIQVSSGHIYCISDTDVYLLSDKGDVLRHAECGFGAVRLSVLSSNTVAVITDNRIDKISLDQQ